MKRYIFSVLTIRQGGNFLFVLFISGFILNTLAFGDQKLPATQENNKDSKISSLITSTVNKMKVVEMTKQNATGFHSSSLSNPLLKVDERGGIQTYIHVRDANQENISKLQSIGVKIEIVNTKYNIIQGWIPFDKVEEAGSLNFIKSITAPSYGKLSAGSVISEGDSVIRSNLERSQLGFDGAGIRVGVISDGIDHISASQASGDIPANILVGNAGSGDEGTALLEIVHDIAPGAELAFSEGFSTSMAFINSIVFLVNTAKADVIVSDIEFLNEPYFEDGMIAQEADNAVLNGGVVFVSSAGNDADEHYQANYVEASPENQPSGLISEPHFHDFGAAAGGASDIFMQVLVGGAQFAPNNFITVILQWNDPFGSSSSNYDLYLLDDKGNLLDRSTNPQTGSQDPLEVVSFQNNTSNNIMVNVAINRVSGSSRTLEMFFNGAIKVKDFNVPTDSIFGHAAARDVIAVGAVPAINDFCQGNAFGPDQIEDYSSLGPRIILSEAQPRLKPNIVAPDDIHITGAGGFGSPDGRGGFILCGTSGSAPHVAGVAALILSKNPGLTPDQVRSALENTAVDLGTSGADNTFGFGRVDALAAVQSVSGGATKPPATQPPSNGGGSSSGGSGGGCALGGQNVVGQVVFFNLLIFLIPVAMLGLNRLINKIRQGEWIR
jgi:subtilisin family serine protease